MRHQIYASILLLIWILVPAMSYGQTLDSDAAKRQLALQQLEGILEYAKKIDAMPSVKVKAKAAAVLWSQSPDRARTLFLSLWEFVEQQKEDKSFDREEARLVVLRQLYSKDQKLASQLLAQLAGKTKADERNQLSFDKIRGTNEDTRRLARLALQLVDVDPMLAAKVAQQSLSQNTAPMAMMVLSRLKESDPLFADYLAMNVLENFKHQPPTIAMTGLMNMVTYLFPPIPIAPVSDEVERADEGLQSEFMSAGYQILKASLAVSEGVPGPALSSESIQFLAISQVIVAVSLGAMAPRYAPGLVNELDQISGRLLRGLPPAVAQAAAIQAAVIRRTGTLTTKGGSDDAADAGDAILAKIAAGQFDNAQSLIDKLKDERQKKAYGLTLLKAQFKTYLTHADLNAATKTARKVEDSASRIQMFAEIARLAHQKQEWAISADVLAEARKTFPSPDRGVAHIRALFSLASATKSFSAPEALVVLHEAVRQINALPNPDKEGNNSEIVQSSSLNDPDRLIDSIEMMKAFSTLGRDYFDDTLVIAEQLDNKAVQAMARLATVENLLKVPPPVSKSKTSVAPSKPE